MEKNFLRFSGLFLVIISLGLSLCFSIIKSASFLPVSIGIEDEQTFLSKKVSFYDDMVWLNSNLPNESLVFFNHYKPYYFDKDYYIPELYLRYDFERMNHNQFFEFLVNKGITHIFLPNDVGRGFKKFISLLFEEKKISIFYENIHAKRIKSRNLNTFSEVGLKVFKIDK
tara:strand:- start:412 stop:921 length:510 start_codon:yes stop_codon:yes gene_type:complete